MLEFAVAQVQRQSALDWLGTAHENIIATA